MKHAVQILVAIALAFAGGGVLYVARTNLTTPIVVAAFGSIYFALFLGIRSDATEAAAGLASSAKQLVDAVKSVLGTGGNS